MQLFRSHSLENVIAQAVGRGHTNHVNYANHANHANQEYLTLKGWSALRLAEHFYTGRGRGVTLQEIGLLNEIRNEANRKAINRNGGFKDQIKEEVVRVKNGRVYKNFNNSYDFKRVLGSLGGGTLSGEFVGRCALETLSVGALSGALSVKNARIEFSGDIHVKYSDKYVDPLSIIEFFYEGDSESPRAPKWLKDLADFNGTRYPITGSWNEQFSGVISL